MRAGEGRAVGLLFAYACAMGLGNTVLDTAANALFLTYHDVGLLPWVYMGSAALTVAFGMAYSRLESRVSPPRLLLGTSALLVLSMVLFHGAATSTGGSRLALGLMMWKDVQYILSAVVLWAVAGMLFDLRQGKRLFGLIGAGDVLGIIVGGLAVPFIVRAAGAKSLLAVGAAAQAATFGVLLLTIAVFRARLEPSPTTRTEGMTDGPRRRPLREILRDPFVRILFAVSAVSYLGYYFVDLLFYERVDAMFPDTNALARFYGYFAAAMGAVNLFANVFLSGPIMTRFGVRTALLVLPGAVMIGVVVTLGASLTDSVALAAWAMVATKLFDEVLRKSIERPSYSVVYQPLPRRERLRVQAVRESVVEPLAMGASGVVLLVLGTWLELPVDALLWTVLGVVVVWLAWARGLGSRYIAVLRDAVARRRAPPLDGMLPDAERLRLANQYLASADGVEVVYALRTLEAVDHRSLIGRSIALIAHPDPMVRTHVLRTLERRADRSGTQAVRERARCEPDAAIRGHALRALAALTADRVAVEVVTAAATGAPETRRGALVGLLRHGGAEGARHAEPIIDELARSHAAADRVLAAETLGEAGLARFHRSLLPLMRDEDGTVRRSAIRAAGAVGHPGLVQVLLGELASPEVRDVAAAAIVAAGDVAVPALVARLDDASLSAASRARAAAMLGRIGTARSSDVLRARVDCDDVSVRGHVLAALLRAARPGADRRRLGSVLSSEIEWQAALHFVRDDIGGMEDLAPLAEAIRQEALRARERMLAVVALLHPGDSMLGAIAALGGAVPERRAHALEVIDTTLPRRLRRAVLPLVEDLSDAERAARLSKEHVRARRTPAEHVAWFAALPPGRSGSWLRAIAIHLLASLYLEERLPPPTPSSPPSLPVPPDRTQDPEPIVREASAWLQRRIARFPLRGWTPHVNPS